MNHLRSGSPIVAVRGRLCRGATSRTEGFPGVARRALRLKWMCPATWSSRGAQKSRSAARPASRNDQGSCSTARPAHRRLSASQSAPVVVR